MSTFICDNILLYSIEWLNFINEGIHLLPRTNGVFSVIRVHFCLHRVTHPCGQWSTAKASPKEQHFSTDNRSFVVYELVGILRCEFAHWIVTGHDVMAIHRLQGIIVTFDDIFSFSDSDVSMTSAGRASFRRNRIHLLLLWHDDPHFMEIRLKWLQTTRTWRH
jgi:hypothetical protein